jgi:hypothetical protein
MTVVALSFRGIEVDFYFRNRPDLRMTCKIRNSLSSVFYSNLRMTFMELSNSVLCSCRFGMLTPADEAYHG